MIVTDYYIIGPNAGDVTMADFNGQFFSGDIGVDVGISIGRGAVFSNTNRGAYIIGISRSIGIGVCPSAISCGLNGGILDFYSNY